MFWEGDGSVVGVVFGKRKYDGVGEEGKFSYEQLGAATLSQHVDLEKGLIVIDLLHKMPHQRGGLGLLVGEAII